MHRPLTRGVVAALVVVAGCGRIGYDATADGEGPPICDWSQGVSFSTPVRIAELGSPGREAQPFLPGDGLTVYFASQRVDGGNFDMFQATRPDRFSGFTAPRPMDDLNSDDDEYGIAFDPGGLVVYLATSRPGGPGNSDIWRFERPSLDQPFEAVAPVDAVNTADHEWDPFVIPSGLRLYYVAYTPSSSVVMVERTSVDVDFAAPPVVVPGVSSDNNEGNPSLTDDGRVLVFNRNDGVVDDSQIHYSVRSSPDEAFSHVGPVPGVNLPAQDAEPYVTADGCELFFTSDRDGESEIYQARFQDVASP